MYDPYPRQLTANDKEKMAAIEKAAIAKPHNAMELLRMTEEALANLVGRLEGANQNVEMTSDKACDPSKPAPPGLLPLATNVLGLAQRAQRLVNQIGDSVGI